MMAKGKGRGRYQFTTRRRGALKKAQMISARKRKGRGGGMSGTKGFALGAGAGVGVLGLVGTAYFLGSKTTSHKNTPGGSENSHPMGTDPNKTAGDILAPTYKEPSIERADPQGMTTRVAKKAAATKAAKKAAQKAASAPKRKGTATAAAQAVEESKAASGAIPPTRKGATPTTSTPSVVNTTTAASGTSTAGYTVTVKNGLDILSDPQVHDQIKDWKTGVHATMKERITLELDKVNFGVSSNGVLFKKGPGSRRARKAAKTRAANASS